MRTILLEIPEGKFAEWVDGVLTLIDIAPVQERIKSYEDALKVLGEQSFPFGGISGYLTRDMIAYIYTKEELSHMGQEKRARRRLIELCELTLKSDSSRDTPLGFTCASTNYTRLGMTACVCSDHCLKSKELADYCRRQFIDLWFEFSLPGKIITKKKH